VTSSLVLLDNALDRGFYRPADHWRRALGRDIETVDVSGGAALPRPDAHTHLLITGSEASILSPAPWALAEMAWLQEAIAGGARVLGSCWGHQMIAATLGGTACVRRSSEPEIGWRDITVSARDLILPAAPFQAFCVHFDEVVPGSHPDLRVLAASEECAVHAFRWGDLPVWGLQSHPEIDPPTARAMMAEELRRFPTETALWQDALAERTRDSGHARAILDAFLAC
jgi:GMP synthase (glutamine-hydrolysing)